VPCPYRWDLEGDEQLTSSTFKYEMLVNIYKTTLVSKH
jgi:hypothetical protein